MVELVIPTVPVEDAGVECVKDVELENLVSLTESPEGVDVVSAPVATVPTSDEAALPDGVDVRTDPEIVELEPAPTGVVDVSKVVVEFQPVSTSPEEELEPGLKVSEAPIVEL